MVPLGSGCHFASRQAWVAMGRLQAPHAMVSEMDLFAATKLTRRRFNLVTNAKQQNLWDPSLSWPHSFNSTCISTA